MTNTRSDESWLLILICAASALAPTAIGAQTGADELDARIAGEVAAFSGSLEPTMQLTAEQQAHMAELLREERAALTRALAPAKSDAPLQRRALDKGIALDATSLELMQRSLGRLLIELEDVLSPEQLQRFAVLEQHKLDTQRRFLQMDRTRLDEGRYNR